MVINLPQNILNGYNLIENKSKIYFNGLKLPSKNYGYFTIIGGLKKEEGGHIKYVIQFDNGEYGISFVQGLKNGKVKPLNILIPIGYIKEYEIYENYHNVYKNGSMWKCSGGSYLKIKGKTIVKTNRCSMTKYVCEFEDGTFGVFSGSELSQGQIKNKNKPKVYNVGYLGYGKYTKKYYELEYKKWTGMLQRCYNLKYQQEYAPSYIDTFVDERWHNFQNFCEDIEKLKGYEDWKNNPNKYSLDKDEKNGNNKLYSFKTCSFILKDKNSSIITKNTKTIRRIGIICKGANGNFYKKFNSITDAVKYFKSVGVNIEPSLIFKVRKGERKFHNEYNGEKLYWEEYDAEGDKIKNNIDKDIIKLISFFKVNGYDLYLVGGAIRDILIDKTPKDYDLCTNAPFYFIDSNFKTIDSGREFGTITVIYNNNLYEITKLRKDIYNNYNRFPEVIYTDKLEDDFLRRDFLINSFYFDGENLIDIKEGYRDLYHKIIRTCDEPNKTFSEDPLRMLRAIRFSCVLNFNIYHKAYSCIKENSQLINNISKERIRDELCKILMSNSPARGIELLYDLELLKHILPDIHNMRGFNQNNPHHYLDLYQHTISVLSHTEPNLILRLSALLHDVGKIATHIIDENGISHYPSHEKVGAQIAEVILRDLKFDNSTIESVTKIISDHMSKSQKVSDKAIKRFINRIGIENVDNCLKLMRADIYGHKPPHDMESMTNLENKVKEILEKKEPLNVLELSINGKDLINLGLKPSSLFKIILDDCLDIVLDNSDNNSKEFLIEYIKEKYIGEGK